VKFVTHCFGWLARLFKRNQQRAPVVVLNPIWTPDDALMLKKFFTTATGQRLIARFEAMAVTQALAGCADPMHTGHSAGVGHGFNEAKEWLLSLSRVTGAQVAQDEDRPQGEPDYLDQLSP